MRFNFAVSFLRQRDDMSVSRFDFLNIGNHLIKQSLLSSQRPYDGTRFHQGNCTVLQLSCGNRKGVDIGNLLQLEGALISNTGIHPTTDVEHLIPIIQTICQCLNFRCHFQNIFQLTRNCLQILYKILIFFR